MRRPDAPPRLSVVITAHNEGAEVRRTIESVRANTITPFEILLVDDGSTDGCCDSIDHNSVRVIRRESRVGVASSRALASLQARGEVLAYLDAHQRLEPACLDRCAELALSRRCLVTPDLCEFDDDRRLHGAYFVQRASRPCFGSQWKCCVPRNSVTRISSLRAPLYVLPRQDYAKLCWSPALRGWGGTEAALSLKAFFAGVDIVHLCGPLALHRFKGSFHYHVDSQQVWRNHAIVARICFEEQTWRRHWRPAVFETHLREQDLEELEGDAILAERDEFARYKVRRDEEYWTRLVFRALPTVLRGGHRVPTGAT